VGAVQALTELVSSFPSAEVLVLCYHEIRSRERFVGQMSVLVEEGYSVLSMGQFAEWLGGRQPLRSPAVVLTFDGRAPEQFSTVIPILQSFNFSATFFPVSCYLSGEAGDELVMRRNALRHLAQSGYVIGCHSHTHQDLTKLSIAELLREVVASKQMLEDVLGQRVSAFCYPYGACDARVREVVKEAGFDVAFTVDLGGVSSGDDPYSLKRAPVLGEPSSAEFGVYLSGRFLVSGSILLYWKVRERVLDRKAFLAEAEA
jgi:peptidoglycan/xylan/chitin deacetylase (PgdA/CDA1 family)